MLVSVLTGRQRLLPTLSGRKRPIAAVFGLSLRSLLTTFGDLVFVTHITVRECAHTRVSCNQ